MAKISDEHLNCIATLYKKNTKTGMMNAFGTAFLVEYSDDLAVLRSSYLVTCAHCVAEIPEEADFTTGETLSLSQSGWKHDPKQNDIAAMDVTEMLPDKISKLGVPFLSGLISGLTKEYRSAAVGDDIYMIGLNTAEDLSIRGTHPRARFGNISAWAHEERTIKQGNDVLMPSHIGDMRSRPGFSGSPVFAIPDISDWSRSPSATPFGVHSAQFKERIEVLSSSQTFVHIPSSMTIIVPWWNLDFIIDDPDFKAARQQREL